MENQTHKSVLDRIKERQEKTNSGSQNSTSKFPKIDWEALKKKRFYPKGEKELFRLIPFENGDVFMEGHYHFMQVNGQRETFYCTQHNDGTHCPLCEAKKALYAKAEEQTKANDKAGADETKKLAYKFNAAKYYIVQGVDMNKMNEGKKLWLFREDRKGKGVYEQIMEIFNEFGDITNYEAGYDLTIKCGKNDKGKMVLTSIMCVKPTNLKDRLSSNDIELQDVINEKVDWKNIYGKTIKAGLSHEEYLEKVAIGDAPYWSDSLKKFVYPSQAKAAASQENGTDEEDNKFTDGSDEITLGSDADDLPF
jgi:hypothetical protein